MNCGSDVPLHYFYTTINGAHVKVKFQFYYKDR